jgi:hypothetical protein
MKFPQNLNLELPYDPAVQLLGVCHRDPYTPMFTAAQLTIVKLWDQPSCPLLDEWMKKWGTYTVKYYSAIKKNEIMGHQCCAYNPSYSGSIEQEDHGLRPAQANSSRDPVSKIPSTKRASGAAQVVTVLRSKCESLTSSPRAWTCCQKIKKN